MEFLLSFETLVDVLLAALAYLLYKLLGKRPWSFWGAVLALYLSLVFSVTGLPSLQYLTFDHTVNLIPFSDFRDSRFLYLSALNMVMTMPLGVLLPLAFRKYRRFTPTLLAGFFTSLTIEVLQLFCFRTTDIDDLILNTLGTVLGFFLGKLLFSRLWPRCGDQKDGYGLLTGILILLCFFLRQPLYGMPYLFS